MRYCVRGPRVNLYLLQVPRVCKNVWVPIRPHLGVPTQSWGRLYLSLSPARAKGTEAKALARLVQGHALDGKDTESDPQVHRYAGVCQG